MWIALSWNWRLPSTLLDLYGMSVSSAWGRIDEGKRFASVVVANNGVFDRDAEAEAVHKVPT